MSEFKDFNSLSRYSLEIFNNLSFLNKLFNEKIYFNFVSTLSDNKIFWKTKALALTASSLGNTSSVFKKSLKLNFIFLYI